MLCTWNRNSLQVSFISPRCLTEAGYSLSDVYRLVSFFRAKSLARYRAVSDLVNWSRIMLWPKGRHVVSSHASTPTWEDPESSGPSAPCSCQPIRHVCCCLSAWGGWWQREVSGWTSRAPPPYDKGWMGGAYGPCVKHFRAMPCSSCLVEHVWYLLTSASCSLLSKGHTLEDH